MKMNFGHWLKREIENRTLSLSEFAQSIGVSRDALTKWIRSDVPAIRGVNIVRIARGLGISREEVESHLSGRRSAA